MKVEIFKDQNLEYRVRLRFDNGRIFATSEGYGEYRAAFSAVASFVYELRGLETNPEKLFVRDQKQKLVWYIEGFVGNNREMPIDRIHPKEKLPQDFLERVRSCVHTVVSKKK